MKFHVEQAIFDALPNACFGVVIAKGINNTAAYPRIGTLLQEGITAAEARFLDAKVKEDAAIVPYRDAFTAFSINPNKFMSSIEALFTRVSKGKGLPAINPIVDLGNAMSLKYTLPMGAHDIEKLNGEDMVVRLSREGDVFLPFGENAAEDMPAGEPVYVAGNAVRTRRWIWRQSELGKIDESTSDIFFPIDGFKGVNEDAVRAAAEELAGLCIDVFGCTGVRTGFVDAGCREIAL